MTSGDDERMIDWIMYAKIQDLMRQKYKKAKVAKNAISKSQKLSAL